MAKIGATPGGGVQRLALTDEDRTARDRFVEWLEMLDARITVDEMGNIFGRRAGERDELAPVVTGSHLDSQPRGGRFDGALGVMAALEVLRTLEEHRVVTKRPVVAVNWTDEEGSRFAPAMLASGVWTGALERDWAYARTDSGGRRFVDELVRIGYRGPVPARAWPMHAYFEYHIEQGPILESRQKLIGVPEGVVSMHWSDVYLEGEANQVGPTPMAERRDALCAAAEMILAVNGIPAKVGGNLVATVGEIENEPNSRNIIPDRVHFTVDLRSWDDDRVAEAWKELRRAFEAIAGRRGCSIRIEETWSVEHSPFDGKLVERVVASAAALGYSTERMVSGAGHDAAYLSRVAPTAMIFVPSVGGRSHVEVENTPWEECEAGANVLLRCVLESANETLEELSPNSHSHA
jgi:N-carbamoyl-L-amino-acid hydrolase